jgi:hypothetical protein
MHGFKVRSVRHPTFESEGVPDRTLTTERQVANFINDQQFWHRHCAMHHFLDASLPRRRFEGNHQVGGGYESHLPGAVRGELCFGVEY